MWLSWPVLARLLDGSSSLSAGSQTRLSLYGAPQKYFLLTIVNFHKFQTNPFLSLTTIFYPCPGST